MLVAAPRLSSRWRVLVHGEDVVSDVEALQRLRSPEPKRAEWSWRFLSSRFGGKVAREAFEAFTAAAQELGSAGDVYDALLTSGADREEVRRASGPSSRVDDDAWNSLVNQFAALASFDRTNASAEQREWRPKGYYEKEEEENLEDPRFYMAEEEEEEEKQQQQPEATVEWLVARIDALPQKALGTMDVALAVAAAARNNGVEGLQAALEGVLGFSDESFSFMIEIVDRKEAIAGLDASVIRQACAFDGDQQMGGSKQGKKKRWKKELKLQKNQTTALSKSEETVAALGLSTKNSSASFLESHTESLLTNVEREYRENRSGLPADATRFHGDGYEEVVLPPPKRLPDARPDELVAVASLPPWASACFPKSTKTLNRVQSAVFPCCFQSQRNTLVCAPTGAGKTYVALLCILELYKRALATYIEEDDDSSLPASFAADLAQHKVVYIAPLKALAQEVVQKFSERLKPLGLIVKELTGDVQLTKREADAAHVLVATPEKWDVVTRKQGTEGSLAARCKLLIVDEIHLLAEERGAVLECIVARTRRLVESSQSRVRLVGLSATLPNYLDVADFMACPDDGVFFFGPEFRPVPLQQTFVGVGEDSKNTGGLARLKRLAKMDDLCFEKALNAVDRGHQVMIFVHSRKDTTKTATMLRDRARKENRSEAFCGDKDMSRFKQALDKTQHRDLRDLAPFGMTLHHAGMSRSDRGLAEDMFARGAVKVLCCTATLAWGVNLPAHAVICKGTEVYDPQRGGHVDLSMLDVLQIFGRAGRPQFDDFGEATLITSMQSLPEYLRKLARAAHIESCLVPRLADAINAEVAAGTVSSINDALQWLDHTFLAVRLRKNPLAYGGKNNFLGEKRGTDKKRALCVAAAEQLNDARMVRFNVKTGLLSGTHTGRVGSHYYLRHESVREFGTALMEESSDATILAAVCSAHEFDQLQARADEIPELDRLRLGPACPLHRTSAGGAGGARSAAAIAKAGGGDDVGALLPGPLAKIVDEPAGKAACLFQAHVSRAPIQSFTLSSDAAYVAKNASRVCRALFETALAAKYAGLAEKLLQFAIALERRVWWFQTPIRQLADLEPSVAQRHQRFPEQALRHLEDKKVSLDRLLVDVGSAADLGAVVRNSKAGATFHQAAKQIPFAHVDCTVLPITPEVLRFVIDLTPDYDWSPRVHGVGPEPFWLWVEARHPDFNTDRVLHCESFQFSPVMTTQRDGSKRRFLEATTVAFTLAVTTLPSEFIVRVLSDRWLGSTVVHGIQTSTLQMPTSKSYHTDLLPLHPLPITALGVPEFQELYRGFSHFNPVQTQLFYCLYHTDRNVLLGAPTGSGKTLIAELAVMRMLKTKKGPDAKHKPKAIYVAPLKALARERLKDWKKKFGENMGLTVLELTGDATPDQRALRDADILITTPEKWDGVTRLWKQRDYARQAALLIIDEIHLLGEDRGPVIEAIVSRARFMCHQEQQKALRIVGLSTAVSNAMDLADWLGVEERMGLYNFRSSVRPVTIDAHIQGFRGKHYCPRMATMNKPCYVAIREHAQEKPALVFVASRRQTRLTAIDLIAIAGADDNVKGGATKLWVSDDVAESRELEVLVDHCEDPALRETLAFGVGIHHAGLVAKDRDVVEKLFALGKIRVLVCTATLAWGVNFPARLVVIKGTEFYDAKVKKYVDFPITDVLQMMGRAGRPQFDTTGVAVVMVQDSKKEFYKRFLFSPFPVESHLRENLHNLLMAEICSTGAVATKKDAVDFLTFTYFYRRLKQNPAYYHLHLDDTTTQHLESRVDIYLKELVETTVEDLAKAGAIETSTEDDVCSLTATTLGKIASYYYLDYKTTRDASEVLDFLEDEVFTTTDEIRDETAAIELLCDAREFEELPVRHNEDKENEELAEILGIADFADKDFEAPATKAQLLVHARLRNVPLAVADYVTDTRSVLENSARVLAAMIDVAADAGAIKTTLALCRLSQALGSGCSFRRDELCQVPPVNDALAAKLRKDIGSSKGLNHPRTRKALRHIQGADSFLDALPVGDTRLEANVEAIDSNKPSSSAVLCDTDYTLRVTMALGQQQQRHSKKNSSHDRQSRKLATWWLILAERDELIALKRVGLSPRGSLEATLRFTTSEDPGPSSLTLYALASDIRGFDAHIDIPLDVLPAM